MSGGVLPAVLITADGGDGEGVSGQCVDFGGSELGSEIEDVGAIGPFDVAVVSGSDGDDVVGIEVVPGDLSCGGERAAPSASLAAPVCVMAEISGWSLVPVRVMVTTFDRSGGVIACAGVIDGDDVEGEGESFALA